MLHGAQAQPVAVATAGQGESFSIVLDGEHMDGRFKGEGKGNLMGLSVAESIGRGLLGDAVEVQDHIRAGNVRAVLTTGKLTPDRKAIRDLLGEQPEGGNDSPFGDAKRCQAMG